MYKPHIYLFSALLLMGCQYAREPRSRLFEQIETAHSGITFANRLSEDSIVNYFSYPYLYMGGGVAVGDVNNDGLQDLFFTGNRVSNKLYLNKGNFQFEDITEAAGVAGDDRWATGVSMADVNGDGWTDIYVCVSGKFTTTKNLLYINNARSGRSKGLLSEVPTFTESAQQAGIDDEGHSTQATFFDYDNDGDLDMYLANYPYTSFKTGNFTYKFKIDQKDPKDSDKLFANDGNGKFTDITEQAGLLNFGLSLGATAGDFDQNGWMDIYVSNDFATPDHLYLNQGNGTFTDEILKATAHIPFFGMGVDVADFNNDGRVDVLQMDMTPENNRRNKANMASMNPGRFHEMVALGMHYQYMQNALQLNRGADEKGIPQFSDLAQMSNLASTDWSWAGLFADLDNDGWKDIFITNGIRRDINNKDFFKKIEDFEKGKGADYLNLTKAMPSERVKNYAFRNNGDLTFSRSDEAWGLDFSGFSNGVAYADLDNDGDLDLVLNNIDNEAILYKNTTTEQQKGNYLSIVLEGPAKNRQGLGAKLSVSTAADTQYFEQTLTRGFQSAVSPVLHVGLGDNARVLKLKVTWPDAKVQHLSNIAANQRITLKYNDAGENLQNNENEENFPFRFQKAEVKGFDYRHRENAFDDFRHQVLLPHVYSQEGPAMAVGDVNGDGLDDVFMGGAVDVAATMMIQQHDGTFIPARTDLWQKDKKFEDVDALLTDLDLDGDLDLYVVSGGNEFDAGAKWYADRLYLNWGQGNWVKADNLLPFNPISGSVVKAADYDKDGDLDLFIGGRLVPHAYPMPASSFILRNDYSPDKGLSFTDVTAEVAPGLKDLGLVTDALWNDFDRDGNLDIILVGEWMPISIFKYDGNKFVNSTEALGLANSTGWWYSIEAGDFDADGDSDFVVGNLGLNYKYKASKEETFDIYAGDYDENGKPDIVLGYYHDGVQFPVRGRQCSAEQIPAINTKFPNYNTFAEASLAEIYTEGDLQKGLHYKATVFASLYLQNNGKNFSSVNLPNSVQISCINDFHIGDFNDDGFMDMLVAGNKYGVEVETTRNDASYGACLLGHGDGTFTDVSGKSRLLVKGETRKIRTFKTPNGEVFCFARNNDKPALLRIASD